MAEATLSEILAARENRARLQTEISNKYRTPLISFTMNIAGPIKNSPLIARAFKIGLARLDAAIDEEKILFRHVEIKNSTGPCAILAVNEDPVLLKELCVNTEDGDSPGRLFDMDVINESLERLSRPTERGCIICGASGRACAAGRVHPTTELQTAMNGIMSKGVFEIDSARIAALATESLIKEVRTTPKPGLVDLRNNGSHRDMTPLLFEKSALALQEYFFKCIQAGKKNAASPYGDLFSELRKEGLVAERLMYKVTGGANTHKGAIFSFGLLLGSIGRLWNPDNPTPSANAIFSEAARLANIAIEADFSSPAGLTSGERIYVKRGIKGVRGEAASGFSSVRDISLPAYRNLRESGLNHNDSGVITLIHLISKIDDTTAYSRGGEAGLAFVKEYAMSILQEKKPLRMTRIEAMDDEFIKRNLSAGGAADLLAVTYFMADLEDYFR